MNVLVYSGPEVLQSSLTRSIALLKSLLQPNYTVQAITSQSLSSQPWPVACALLVLPACRESLYFSQSLSNQIRNYVEGGGSFLGIRSGFRTSGGSILAPSEYTLRFSDKSSGSTVYYKTIPGGDEDLRLVSIKSSSVGTFNGLHHVETPETVGLGKLSNVEILAQYTEGEGIAGALVRLGEGRAISWGVHIENPVPQDGKLQDDIRSEARLRLDLVRDTLRRLGLKLPSETSDIPTRFLPQFFTAVRSENDIIKQILSSLEVQLPAKLEDANDTFYFHTSEEGQEILQNIRSGEHIEEDEKIKHIAFYPSGKFPSPSVTPLFDIPLYYTYLTEARDNAQLSSGSWGIGECLLYGEVVSSTQTLLDRYVV